MRRCLAAVVLTISLSTSVAEAAFPARNGSILFIRSTAHGSRLTAMAPDGTRRVIASGYFENPQWSPNGRWILFGDGYGSIAKIRPDGSGFRLVTPEDMTAINANWSPDGRWIVFEKLDAYQAGMANLYRIREDGSGLKQLTSDPACEKEPVWSPDGQTIAYIRQPTVLAGYGVACFGPTEINLMDPDGTDVRQLTTSAEWWESAPDWSPDGSALIVECMVPVDSGAGGETYICSVDSATAVISEIVTGDEGFDPSWSPNGRKITFELSPHTEEDVDSEIAVVNPDGSQLRRLTDTHRDDSAPDWGPR